MYDGVYRIMGKRQLRSPAFAVLAVSVLAVPVLAQTFEERQQRDVATNPADLHFRLDTAEGQRTFRMGERIPLILRFSSDSPDKYKLNGATYDRSGRLPTEEFVLERDDVPDPYQDYFRSGVIGGLTGGLRGYPVLKAEPYEINLDLNDWFRFDAAGRYRLYLKSHRLTREAASGESTERTVQFAAVSNVLELEITEDAAWRAIKLSELRSILEQPDAVSKNGEPAPPGDPLVLKKAQARRELRYLGTAEAARIELDEARRSGNGPDTLLLVGVRDRKQMLGAFDSYLTDEQVGFHEFELRLRALFTFVLKDAPEPLPIYVWQLTDGYDTWDKVRAAGASRRDRFEEILREEAVRLIPAVLNKEESARKVSAAAIASVAKEAAKTAGLVPPDDYGLSREELIAQFAAFPRDRQVELLGKKWDLIRGPAVIPELKKVIRTAAPKPIPENSMALHTWGTGDDIAESALRRLMELAPEEAVRIVRADIASGHPSFAGLAVRVIPAQDVPEADDALSGLLTTDYPGVLPLVAKFGTARLTEQMRQLYQEQSRGCFDNQSFAAYFVRTSQADRAHEILKQVMTDSATRGCFDLSLAGVAEVVWNPTVEAQVLANLV